MTDLLDSPAFRVVRPLPGWRGEDRYVLVSAEGERWEATARPVPAGVRARRMFRNVDAWTSGGVFDVTGPDGRPRLQLEMADAKYRSAGIEVRTASGEPVGRVDASAGLGSLKAALHLTDATGQAVGTLDGLVDVRVATPDGTTIASVEAGTPEPVTAREVVRVVRFAAPATPTVTTLAVAATMAWMRSHGP